VLLLPVSSLAQESKTGASRQSAVRDGVEIARDGFESDHLSDVWEASRFEPGAVQMESRTVRAGRGAAQITVRAHDKFEAGLVGNSDSERAELLEARRFISKADTGYEYSFSIFLPADFPIVPTRLVIAQWKQYCPEGRPCSDDSPVLAIRYMGGVLRITQDIGRKQSVIWEEKGEFRARWLDFRIQVRFSAQADGRIRAWLGDRALVNYTGITANGASEFTGYTSPDYYYFKMGLYRNVMAEPMTIYIDEYRKSLLPRSIL
jgi:hypothetical protein